MSSNSAQEVKASIEDTSSLYVRIFPPLTLRTTILLASLTSMLSAHAGEVPSNYRSRHWVYWMTAEGFGTPKVYYEIEKTNTRMPKDKLPIEENTEIANQIKYNVLYNFDESLAFEYGGIETPRFKSWIVVRSFDCETEKSRSDHEYRFSEKKGAGRLVNSQSGSSEWKDTSATLKEKLNAACVRLKKKGG